MAANFAPPSPNDSFVDNFKLTRVGFEFLLNVYNAVKAGFSGDYNDLINKPTIPAAQVNSDWNATSGIAQILNKPNIQATRVSIGSISASSVSFHTVNWPTAWADTNYTVSALVEGTSGGAGGLELTNISTHTTTSVQVTIKNNQASAITGTVHLIGIHD